MRTTTLLLAASCTTLAVAFAFQPEGAPLPTPKVITPGTLPTDQPTTPPSDAVVLFDGTAATLANWAQGNGSPAGWTLDGKDGAMTAAAGSIMTKESFSDCQLHIEFATPAVVQSEGQGRGNSGVYFQARYEVQVLDSFKNQTYPDGQCASIYKQHPPLVNASRGPGQWQTYDIVFRAARFDASGKKTKNATLTVFHNGVLVQDHAEVTGPTGSAKDATEQPTSPGSTVGSGPIYLQDHGNPVRYRNIWLRRL
jgi:hypothetical protein